MYDLTTTMEEEKQKSFLEEVQAFDESVKRKILVVATVVIMIVVAYVWVGYFNGLVAGSSQQDQPPVVAAAQTPSGNSGYNLWQSMTSGMADIVNTFRGPGQYTVTPQ
jgi:hypothetical protein